jgi:hypothetical protein
MYVGSVVIDCNDCPTCLPDQRGDYTVGGSQLLTISGLWALSHPSDRRDAWSRPPPR